MAARLFVTDSILLIRLRFYVGDLTGLVIETAARRNSTFGKLTQSIERSERDLIYNEARPPIGEADKI